MGLNKVKSTMQSQPLSAELSTYEATGRLQRKIDVFRKGTGYVCSTNWHARCRDAVESVAKARNIPATELFARFA